MKHLIFILASTLFTLSAQAQTDNEPVLPLPAYDVVRSMNTYLNRTNHYPDPANSRNPAVLDRIADYALTLTDAGIVLPALVINGAYSQNYRLWMQSKYDTLPRGELIRRHCNWMAAQIQVDVIALGAQLTVDKLTQLQTRALDRVPHDVTFTDGIRRARDRSIRYYANGVDPTDVGPVVRHDCTANPKTFGVNL